MLVLLFFVVFSTALLKSLIKFLSYVCFLWWSKFDYSSRYSRRRRHSCLVKTNMSNFDWSKKCFSLKSSCSQCSEKLINFEEKIQLKEFFLNEIIDFLFWKPKKCDLFKSHLHFFDFLFTCIGAAYNRMAKKLKHQSGVIFRYSSNFESNMNFWHIHNFSHKNKCSTNRHICFTLLGRKLKTWLFENTKFHAISAKLSQPLGTKSPNQNMHY